ncbi:MAG: hypothetical protein IMW99_02260 [Firmicutes bacterium]|nr:hypothetical protein [Bacillota bacterium]
MKFPDSLEAWGHDPRALVVLCILLVSQAYWIFRDAAARGENRWLWGAFGLLNVPSSLIVYLLVTRRRPRGGKRR